jgi:hypothetical protein
MARNNNAFGRERDEKALAKLTEAPWTARQLVKLGIYPNDDICRKRLNRMFHRDMVNRIGNVNLHGHDEIQWFCGQVSVRQHEAELSEMELGIRGVDEIRRLHDVDPDVRPDAEIVAQGVVLPWEHESSGGLNLRQIKEKMERYGDRHIIWTSKFESHLDKLARHCPSDKHLFTTFALAVEDFHGEIWVNRHGEKFRFEFTPTFTDK